MQNKDNDSYLYGLIRSDKNSKTYCKDMQAYCKDMYLENNSCPRRMMEFF